MRYAWEEGFLDGEDLRGVMRLLLPPLLAWLRRQDRAGAGGPDVFVANSRHVADRIARFYGRSAEIVHPPVDVEHFLALPRAPEDFYLTFGRVVPYKRVDLAVSACGRLGRRLEVAGDGRALDAVRAVAGADTEFLGKVSETDRDRLLGGATESVLDGRTGVLFADQSTDGLVAAIEQFEGLALDQAVARENATRFGRDRFRAEMSAVIERASRARDSGLIAGREPALL
jgi:hypothetical protein